MVCANARKPDGPACSSTSHMQQFTLPHDPPNHRNIMAARLPRLALLAFSLALLAAPACAWPPPDGSLFPDTCAVKTAAGAWEVRRTGIGVRYRAVFKVYVVASYLEVGVK